jgi:hypothetical protein
MMDKFKKSTVVMYCIVLYISFKLQLTVKCRKYNEVPHSFEFEELLSKI